MKEIYVLNQKMEMVGIIDGCVSIIWNTSYSDVGDFEIYLEANTDYIELLQKERYVVRSEDVTVKDGVTTYKKVMIIKNIAIITDEETGDFLNVSGRELKYILHSRIVWKQTDMTGKAENAIRRLVTENAISPEDTKRVIPNLMLDAAAGLNDSIDKQVTGEYLDQSIVDICTNYGYGWDVYIEDQKMKLRVYTGTDRSYRQTQRPYVVFSDDFENLYNTTYELKTEEYANTTLIGGEGEGVERVYTTVGDENEGLERYETFTDARDISSNEGSEDEIPKETYILLLQERGKENLSEMGLTEGFSGEVISDAAFQFEVDFFLGDTVTVINKYGICRDVMVLSAVESEDETGAKLLPQFNM